MAEKKLIGLDQHNNTRLWNGSKVFILKQLLVELRAQVGVQSVKRTG